MSRPQHQQPQHRQDPVHVASTKLAQDWSAGRAVANISAAFLAELLPDERFGGFDSMTKVRLLLAGLLAVDELPAGTSAQGPQQRSPSPAAQREAAAAASAELAGPLGQLRSAVAADADEWAKVMAAAAGDLDGRLDLGAVMQQSAVVRRHGWGCARVLRKVWAHASQPASVLIALVCCCGHCLPQVQESMSSLQEQVQQAASNADLLPPLEVRPPVHTDSPSPSPCWLQPPLAARPPHALPCMCTPWTALLPAAAAGAVSARPAVRAERQRRRPLSRAQPAPDPAPDWRLQLRSGHAAAAVIRAAAPAAAAGCVADSGVTPHVQGCSFVCVPTQACCPHTLLVCCWWWRRRASCALPAEQPVSPGVRACAASMPATCTWALSVALCV